MRRRGVQAAVGVQFDVIPRHPGCPLMRWPQVRAALARKGWRVHHLARELGVAPSRAWAWLYGRGEMPASARRHTERLLELPPNTLD